jgi:methionine synthase II (cobalamin-independent)
MKRSTERILTTHVGSLVRPPDLVQMLRAKESGQPYDRQELAAKVRRAVAEVVHTQVEAGVDVPSDGEYSKPSFSGYVNERFSGFERRARRPGESPLLNWGRDRKHFREFYEEYDRTQGDSGAAPVVCTAPITYVGQAAVQSDIAHFKVALEGMKVEEAFIPAVAPGTIELQRRNEYYPTAEAYLLVLTVRAGAYSVEVANPRHEHEWQVWETVRLPEGKVLIPGVVAHTTNTVEHPELVAWRLVNFARLVGRENVIAGTDCGFSQGAFNPRLHASIVWAKLQALAEGAALATRQLWG